MKLIMGQQLYCREGNNIYCFIPVQLGGLVTLTGINQPSPPWGYIVPQTHTNFFNRLFTLKDHLPLKCPEVRIPVVCF